MKERLRLQGNKGRPVSRVKGPGFCLSVMLLSLMGPGAGLAAEYQPSAIPGWQKILFAGETLYQPQDGCIRAEANGTASGLIREVRQSLDEGEQLSWAWRADDMLSPGEDAAEQSKDGDDFLARIYVIHEGFFFWQTRAINYVWSREHPVGESWPNPYTGNAAMVVVQSGPEGLGQWQTFERDVKADFARFHDLEVEQIDAVAIMTDADNTGGHASACYRLPEFSMSR